MPLPTRQEPSSEKPEGVVLVAWTLGGTAWSPARWGAALWEALGGDGPGPTDEEAAGRRCCEAPLTRPRKRSVAFLTEVVSLRPRSSASANTSASRSKSPASKAKVSLISASRRFSKPSRKRASCPRSSSSTCSMPVGTWRPRPLACSSQTSISWRSWALSASSRQRHVTAASSTAPRFLAASSRDNGTALTFRASLRAAKSCFTSPASPAAKTKACVCESSRSVEATARLEAPRRPPAPRKPPRMKLSMRLPPS
mmetsp:Transcript_66511/g.147301  ORF Transcript_66511/g.147301 Transcript_66511/m.147301 type:complete len:255 (-) Transcript_66511:531-1295(-)